MILEQLFRSFERFVELFAEATDDRLPKRLVHRDPEPFSALACRFADRPAVVVESDRAVREVHQADRIEMAGDGFAKSRFSLPERLFYGAGNRWSYAPVGKRAEV